MTENIPSKKRSGKKKYSTDPKILQKNVEIDYYKSSGPGGQRKNKAETAVRLRHIPSGIMVVATDHRFQSKNKELAFQRLKERLEEENREDKPRITISLPLRAKKRKEEDKRMHSQKKSLRKKIELSDDAL